MTLLGLLLGTLLGILFAFLLIVVVIYGAAFVEEIMKGD